MGIILVCKKIRRRFIEDRPFIATKKILYDFFTREKAKHFGNENPEKTVYIIRGVDYKSPFCIAPVHNLLANYFYVLSHLFYANEKGWIPVVDQQNYPEYNSMDYPVNGTKNAWEYYWLQPSDIALEEAYRSKNVILSKRCFLSKWDIGYDIENYYDMTLLQQFYSISQSVPLNKTTAEHIKKVKTQYIPRDGSVIGVSVRTGGHSKQSLNYKSGHPVQPQIEDLIDLVKKRKEQWNINYIFIASDNDAAVSLFRKAFGDKLIVYNRKRAEIGKEYKLDTEKEMYQKANMFQTTLDYLTEMELLASCDALIGSITSGFRYAVVKSIKNCKHLDVIDCGK